MIRSALLIAFLIASRWALAIEPPEAQPYGGQQDFEKYSVYYTTFDSTFVPPQIASTYKIKRSKYETLINISVAPKGEYGGVPAKVKVTAKNLLQQQFKLPVTEISEDTATYYLAPIRITNKEVIHFKIEVTPQGTDTPLVVEFSKKLYTED